MKAIELTEKHKEMLLEMCKKLFPEHGWNFGSDIEDVGFLDFDFTNVLKENENKNYPDGLIHWFECSWKILNKILEVSEVGPLKVQQEITIYGLICLNDFETCHPVEHLYVLFNKHFNSIKLC